ARDGGGPGRDGGAVPVGAGRCAPGGGRIKVGGPAARGWVPAIGSCCGPSRHLGAAAYDQAAPYPGTRLVEGGAAGAARDDTQALGPDRGTGRCSTSACSCAAQ